MTRTPEQIIGHDALTQLTFEGYDVRRAPAPSQTAVEPVALAQALKNLTEGAEQEDREILYAAASTLTAQAAEAAALKARIAELEAGLERTTDSSEALAAYFNPHLLPAGIAQQLEATIEQNRRARRLHQEKNNAG